jgi:hypothetical protein
VALYQILQALPAITPRLPHDALAANVEHVEEHEGHVVARSLPRAEDCLYALVAVSRTRLPIDGRRACPICAASALREVLRDVGLDVESASHADQSPTRCASSC